METQTAATVEDLYRVAEKAELTDGRIVRMPPTGFESGRAGGDIYSSLRAYERATRNGFATPDNVGYVVDLPNRQTFSPDAAYTRTAPENRRRFVRGAPVFAVEVRSEHDYGATADREYTEKRRDYFAAGTEIVWDVDPQARTVTKYCTDQPDTPEMFRIGEQADAEPALPGWRMAVSDVFDM